MKRLACASICFLWFGVASGADFFTPSNLKTWINKDVLANLSNPTFNQVEGYVLGTANVLDVIQDYGIIPKVICLPAGNLANMRNALNSVDPTQFADTREGGALYIYVAYTTRYPC